MAQVISAHSFKIKFPEFEKVASTRIEFAIEEAALSVDASWGSYQALGMLYYSAHVLLCEISRAASATGQRVASESFAGVLAITYQQDSVNSADPDAQDLTTTFYGLRFLDLMERAVGPAIAII